MLKRVWLIFFLGFFFLTCSGLEQIFAASELALEPSPNGPYYEGPVYFGFSDFSADREPIEDRLISAIREEYEAARAADLTPNDEAWPAGGGLCRRLFVHKSQARCCACCGG